MKVLLREITSDDMELILAWRSIEKVYQGLYQQSRNKQPLTWEEHYHWWNSRHNWKRFIIQVNDSITTRDVGYINLGQLDSWKPQIGYAIGEITLWGKGIGKQAVALALDWLRDSGYIKVYTTVLKSNIGGTKVLEGSGFKRMGEGREDEWEYEKDLRK